MTDCRPVSLFSVQTARRLSEEVGLEVDKRRFRANLYLDLTASEALPRMLSSATPSALAPRP
jgi:uncharacterized protein YcbX